MALENKFIIEVSGDPRPGKDIEATKGKMHRACIKMDNNVKLEERNFMRISYRFTWTGTPVHVENIDNVWNEIGKIARERLEKWEYSLKMNYIETGG